MGSMQTVGERESSRPRDEVGLSGQERANAGQVLGFLSVKPLFAKVLGLWRAFLEVD